MKASMKPIIPTSYEKIVKRFPSKHVNKDENIWNHEVISLFVSFINIIYPGLSAEFILHLLLLAGK